MVLLLGLLIGSIYATTITGAVGLMYYCRRREPDNVAMDEDEDEDEEE
jgi:hypothetical protein